MCDQFAAISLCDSRAISNLTRCSTYEALTRCLAAPDSVGTRHPGLLRATRQCQSGRYHVAHRGGDPFGDEYGYSRAYGYAHRDPDLHPVTHRHTDADRYTHTKHDTRYAGPGLDGNQPSPPAGSAAAHFFAYATAYPQRAHTTEHYPVATHRRYACDWLVRA